MTSTFQLAASQTALRLVRMALLISTTPQEQTACMRAFISQANRVIDLSGYGYALQAEGARASGEVSASCASLPTLPDGNHGENVLPGADRD